MQQCPSCGELLPTVHVICVWCGYDLTAEHIRRAGITINRDEAIRRIQKVVRDPIAAFKEIALIPDTSGPRLVFWAASFALALHLTIIMSKIDGIGYSASAVYTDSIGNNILQFILTLVPTILMWTVVPLFFYFFFNLVLRVGTRITRYMVQVIGGGYDKEKLKSVLGYTAIPPAGVWVLTVPLRLLSSRTSASALAYSTVSDAMQQIAASGVGVVIRFLMVIAWLWSAGLAVIGISKASKLSYAEAVIAAVPYFIFVFFVAF